MINNYIKTAFRSLLKNRSFTAINVLGLALGLSTCLLIVFYVVDELSYDRYNTKANRIYRINEDLKLGDNIDLYAACMAPLAKTLIKDFPQVENAVRLAQRGGFHVEKDHKRILENKVVFADASLFDVFTLPMLQGNPSSALAAPFSVVITETTAKKYFNRTNVVGQTLTIDNNSLLKITGVIQDIPKQSHFNFDFFVSMSSRPESLENRWLMSDFNTYIVLKEGADPKALEAAFPQFMRKYTGAQMESLFNKPLDEFEKSGSYFRINMTPLTDIHLHSNRRAELGTNGNVQYVYIFSAIAIFILLIACVNFMNLSTARSSNRAREVGVRKVLGSPRKHLIGQFLTESIIITFAAAVIALVSAWALLPSFNQLSGKELSIDAHTLTWLIPVLLLIILFVGSLAGSYPAFFLSAFQPIDVLKGKLSAGFKGGRLRSILVIFQFSISIFLIIGTMVVYNQLNYIQNKELGYNRNQVLVIHKVYELNKQAKTFKEEVKQLPGILNASLSGYLPTGYDRSSGVMFQDRSLDQRKSLLPQIWQIDEDYLQTLDIKLASGRNFSKQMLTDSSALIINETAAKAMGMKDPIGKFVYRTLGDNPNNAKEYQIIGVVKDFNFNSLRDNITPVTFVLQDSYGALSLRINAANAASLISQIESKWKQLSTEDFEYSFMDQDFEETYHSERQIGKIFIVFTTLAIVIACLGLFGLAAYAAEQRNKEIGIRKVLGASIAGIVQLLSFDFIKLVLISILIATPVAWFFMHKWLQDFAYRINIQWWVLVIAGLISIAIAFITISFQAIKAALANPVKSLRSE